MKIFFVVIAIVVMVVSASMVLAADDINNSIVNTVTAISGDASAEQAQEQAQEQALEVSVNNSFTYVSEDKREFLAAPPYPGFVNPGQAIMSDGWEIYCPAGRESFSIEEFERMSGTFQFSDIFVWNWKDRVKVTPIGEALPEKNRATAQIHCMNYWPAEKPLGIVRVMGEAGWTDEAFRAKASLECFNGFNSTRVPVRFKNHTDSVTEGRSLGLGGAASQVSGATGVVAAVGGQLGDNRVKSEEYPEFEALCMNDAPAVQTTKKVVKKSVYVEQPTPKPVPSCDVSLFDKQLTEYDQEIALCKFPGHNNQRLRFGKGNSWLDKYYCEGKRNKQYLVNAIYEFGVAERDYENGRELAHGQHFGERPMGVKTTTIPDAKELNYKVNYNRAWAVRELYGQDAEMRFGQSKKLDRVPEFYQELKR